MSQTSKAVDRPSLAPTPRNLSGLNSSQRLIVLWYWMAVVVSVIFILALPIRWYFPQFAPNIIGKMQLTVENNLAAWWSGVLLFMLAVHAYDAYVALRERAPKAARAWAILAGILLFFSADEIGSMHERLGLLGEYLGISTWGLVLPLGGLIGSFLLYALYSLWQDSGESKRHVLPLVIGFGLLGSVVIQEYYELAVDWGTGASVWIRATIEEGSELLGMVVLLGVTLRPTMDIAARTVPSQRRFFSFLPEHARLIFFVLVAFIPVFTLKALILDDQRGQLAEWLAVVSFLTAGLLTLRPVLTGETAVPGRLITIAALCLIASVTPMYFRPQAITVAGEFEINRRVLILAVVGLLSCSLWLACAAAAARNLLWAMGVFGVMLLLSPTVASHSTYAFVATQGLAVLILLVAYFSMAHTAAHHATGAGVATPAMRSPTPREL